MSLENFPQWGDRKKRHGVFSARGGKTPIERGLGEIRRMYSERVMDHFRNPRNVGEIKDADGIGEVGNPVCGDMMTFYIKVNDGKLTDIKFQTFGCGAAIAVSSMVTEMAMNKTLEEALKITNQMVAQELGGLPTNKLHCSNLGADALHKAIEDYLKKQKEGVKSEAKS